MISQDTWDLLLDLLAEVWYWANNVTIINFAGYRLNLVQLWGSACVISITIECIFLPLFGTYGFNVTTHTNHDFPPS